MSDKRRTFAVIDGNSLMHRAFHAVPPTMNAPDGRPTNAIFGFLNMFLKMIDAFNPDGVVVAFDNGKPRVRMEMLPPSGVNLIALLSRFRHTSASISSLPRYSNRMHCRICSSR